jgi:hypothetical protein
LKNAESRIVKTLAARVNERLNYAAAAQNVASMFPAG